MLTLILIPLLEPKVQITSQGYYLWVGIQHPLYITCEKKITSFRRVTIFSADLCRCLQYSQTHTKKNMFQVVVVIAVAVSDNLVKNCKCGARDIVII